MKTMKKIMAAAFATVAFYGIAIADDAVKANPLDDFVKVIQASDITSVEYLLDARQYTVAEFDELIDAADRVVAEKNSCQRSSWNWFKLYFGGTWFFGQAVFMFKNRTTKLQDENFLNRRAPELSDDKFKEYEKELEDSQNTPLYAKICAALEKLRAERKLMDDYKNAAPDAAADTMEKFVKHHDCSNRWNQGTWVLTGIGAAIGLYIGYKGLKAPYDTYARAKSIANGLRQAQEFARMKAAI